MTVWSTAIRYAMYTLFMFALTTDRGVIFSTTLDIAATHQDKTLQPSTNANLYPETVMYFVGFQLIVVRQPTAAAGILHRDCSCKLTRTPSQVMFFMNLFVVVLIRNLHNLHGR